MRGIDVLKDVYALIDQDMSSDAGVRAQEMSFVNHILADLKAKRILTNLNEEIEISTGLYSGLVYGTAMLITAAKGDSIRQQYFRELYNLKRALLSGAHIREDNLPVSLW